ncbi:MAG: sigma-70 family RNA polymerase sigma factor [Ruminococcus sp.]|nr:sigma-70 family RNA polymerase sigma factor [Ruminococcus sp.]MCM1382418.1 sigma-70 family RNA polymerase sigma factor [Muribaculaceae bacterium]
MKFDETYRKYADMVFKYIMAMCGDELLAEELTQETFFRAVKNADSFDGNVKVTTWLCSIAKNAYFTHLKRQSRYAEIDREPSYEADLLDRENCRDIYKAVHSLEEPYREIVLLRIHTDMNFAEIGDIFGKSENWARVTFYRGKEKLRKILESEE